MSPPPPDELAPGDLGALTELNRLRAGGPHRRRDELEARFASRFAADRRLAVYGSLAPGRENHQQLAEIAGRWRSGYSVRGELLHAGWGDGLGYPALAWSLAGPAIPVEVFVAVDLPAHWARLDAFEGDDDLRILVPLFVASRPVAIANLYAAAPRRRGTGSARA